MEGGLSMILPMGTNFVVSILVALALNDFCLDDFFLDDLCFSFSSWLCLDFFLWRDDDFLS